MLITFCPNVLHLTSIDLLISVHHTLTFECNCTSPQIQSPITQTPMTCKPQNPLIIETHLSTCKCLQPNPNYLSAMHPSKLAPMQRKNRFPFFQETRYSIGRRTTLASLTEAVS